MDKENEDDVLVLENDEVLIAMVADGASSLATITDTKGKGTLSGIFAVKHAREGVEKHYKTEQSATALLLAANNQIRIALQEDGIDPNNTPVEELPQEVTTLIRIAKKKQIADIAQIGDTACLVVKKDGEVELAIRRDDNEYDKQAITLAKQIAKEKNISLKYAIKTPEVGDLLLKGRAFTNSNNTKEHAGALNGSSNAENRMQTATYSLKNIRRFILLSDGILFPTENFDDEPNWKEITTIVEQEGLSGLYQRIYGIKSSDPTFDRYPRVKEHDDATGIIITIQH